jgi:radical SAM protein with 4Fe4S-binding SPASM domain
LVSVYLKPTNFCNVGCEHCFLSKEVKADKTVMSMEILEAAAVFIKDMQKDLGATYKSIGSTIIFHGGEPLMAPISWYESAMEVLENTLKDKHSYAFQSSIIPHKPEFYDFIRKHVNSHVGTSLDWSARKINGSPEKYRELFMKRVEEYRENKIACNPSLVPAKDDLGKEKEIIDWFLKNGFSSLQITRFVAWKYDAPTLPTNAEHSQFLINVFDYLMEKLKKGERVLSVKSIHAVIAGILLGISSDTYSGLCQTLAFTIEPNGDLGMCPNRISYEENYGNVLDGWQAFRRNQRRRQWIVKQQMFNLCDKCTGCENIKWCKGNCPISSHCVGGKDDDCAGFKMFIDHVRNFISNDEGKKLVTRYFEDYSYIGNSMKKKG